MTVLYPEAFAAIAVSLAVLASGWAGPPAPVFMHWILIRLTGIPPLQEKMLRSRGDRYRDYQPKEAAI
jgi:steroid 5-alpha reductase family enzyme